MSANRVKVGLDAMHHVLACCKVAMPVMWMQINEV
jgi:hypothetical protein